MTSYSGIIRIWLACLVFCLAGLAVSWHYADVPIALYCSRHFGFLGPVGNGLGSAVILSGEAATVIALGLVRLMHGRLPPAGEALGVACLASICAYGIDSNVLKLLFGVPNPSDVLKGAQHVFHAFAGSPASSFPSGHMVLAAAFAGVVMRLYRRSVEALSVLLLLGGSLLVAGIWHFLSDVIAGAFIGVSVGLLAGELWVVHVG